MAISLEFAPSGNPRYFEGRFPTSQPIIIASFSRSPTSPIAKISLFAIDPQTRRRLETTKSPPQMADLVKILRQEHHSVINIPKVRHLNLVSSHLEALYKTHLISSFDHPPKELNNQQKSGGERGSLCLIPLELRKNSETH